MPVPLRSQLLQLKTSNGQLLEQQAATLEKLDKLQKDAEQVKIFARRT